MINASTLTLGTIIRIWHGTRGHDYVFCGVDKATQEVLLLKNNCINMDGSIHASTKRFHKRLPLIKLAKRQAYASRVSYVRGERKVDPKVIERFIATYGTDKQQLPKTKFIYVCTPVNGDARNSVVYTV